MKEAVDEYPNKAWQYPVGSYIEIPKDTFNKYCHLTIGYHNVPVPIKEGSYVGRIGWEGQKDIGVNLGSGYLRLGGAGLSQCHILDPAIESDAAIIAAWKLLHE